jgi:uncharacterized protein
MSWALIAGGSKGIGYAVSEALARRGYDILLVARDGLALAAAKSKLESHLPVRVETFAADLSLPASAGDIANWCYDNAFELNILCHVAGMGGVKDYLRLPVSELNRMVSVNFISPMGLTLSMLPMLQKNAPSFILNTASLAGFAPFPFKNIYSATKSAVLFFSYSLRNQLKEKNISVSCLCPGPVFTKPAIETETRKRLGWFGSQMAIEPGALGEMAVRQMMNGRMIIVPGRLSFLVSILLRLLPAGILARILSEKPTANLTDTV